MASGKISKTFTNNSSFTMILEWSSKEDVSSNSSTVSATLKMKSNKSYGVSPNWLNTSAWIKIDGASSGSKSINTSLGANKTKTVLKFSHKVNHKSDGSKSFKIEFSANFADVSWHGSRIGTVSKSGSFTLPKIPRAASFSLSNTSVDFGQNFSVNINSPSGGFRYTVNVTGLGSTINLLNKGNGGKHTFNIATSYMSRLTNGTSTSVTCYVDTYDGSTKIGKNSRTLRLNIPSNIVPSISSLTAIETNARVKSLGLAANNFVKATSGVQLKATASGANGSSIKTYAFKLGSKNLSGGTSTKNFSSAYLTDAGTVTAQVTVTDSRGRSSSKSVNLTILDYSPPKISSFTIVRPDVTATSLEMKKSGSFSGLGGKNSATWKLEWRKALEDTWSEITGITAGVDSYTLPGFTIDNSYRFKLSYTDKLATTTNQITLATVSSLLDLHNDEGVGIGKLHEHGTLDVGGPAYFSGRTQLAENTFATQGGALSLSNSDVVGVNGIYFGGHNSDPNAVDPANNDGEALLFPHSNTKINLKNINRGSGWDAFRIIDGIGYLNGAPVMIDNRKALWSGAYLMIETHIITPSVPINKCPNGWLLQWEHYSSGSKDRKNYNYTPISKVQANRRGVANCVINTNASNTDYLANKCIYVDKGVKLRGHGKNNDNNAQYMVLSAVYAW